MKKAEIINTEDLLAHLDRASAVLRTSGEKPIPSKIRESIADVCDGAIDAIEQLEARAKRPSVSSEQQVVKKISWKQFLNFDKAFKAGNYHSEMRYGQAFLNTFPEVLDGQADPDLYHCKSATQAFCLAMRYIDDSSMHVKRPNVSDEHRALIFEALRFFLWGAGQGLSPVDADEAIEPETCLYEYSLRTNDEDWESLPERIRDELDAALDGAPPGEQKG